MLQGDKWLTTATENRKARDAYSLSALYGRHAGQTGILVASGHSLDSNLAKLKRVTTPILAVNRAYPALEITGIPCEYVFQIDALSEPISNKKSTPLICARKSSPEFRKKWYGPKFEFDDILGYDTWSQEFRRENPHLTLLPGGGNVSTLMLNIAIQVLKFNRLVLVGHDFWTPYADEYAMQNESYASFLRWTLKLMMAAMNAGHDAVEFIVTDPMEQWIGQAGHLGEIIHNLIPMPLEEAIANYRL